MAKPVKIPNSLPRKPPLLARLRKEQGSFVYYGRKGWRWTRQKDFNKRVLVKSRRIRTHKWGDAKRGLVNSLTKPHPLEWFGNGRFLGGFILIAIILFGIGIAGGPAFHSYVKGPDPFQNFWDETFPGQVNNGEPLQSYTTTLADFFTIGTMNGGGWAGGTAKVLRLMPNSTNPAIAITKAQMDFGAIAGKELALQFDWSTSNSINLAGATWGFYLTTNKTVPLTKTYDPFKDPNVLMFARTFGSSATTTETDWLFSRSLGSSLQSQMPSSGCPDSSPCMFALTAKTSTAITIANDLRADLNYTGQTGAVAGGNGLSFTVIGRFDNSGGSSTCIIGGEQGSNCATSTTYPWFQLAGEPYYLGFYAAANLGMNIHFLGNPNTASQVSADTIYSWTPTIVTVNPPSPVVDTGGFFGPIIKALISIGVFILQVLITFFAFIASVVQAALDAIGGFLGLGAIGTALFQIFTAAGNFIASAVNAIFSQLSNIVGFITSAATAIVAFLGSGGSFIWTQVTNFFGIWQVLFPLFNTAFLLFTAFSQNGVQLAQYALVFWWLYGIFVVLNSGTEKWWNHWVGMGEDTFKKTFNLGYWIVELVFHWLVWMKNLIAQWV